jgi:hypothetical protein
MPKSKDIRPLTLECQCGNKDPELFKTRVIVTTEEDYEDIPGTTYVWIQCIKCSKHHEITDITTFSGRLEGDDEDEDEDDDDEDWI